MSQSETSLRTGLRREINAILRRKPGGEPVEELPADASLTEDIGLESLDLAELTVKIEEEYGVDVFEDEVVDEVSEVLEKIRNA